MQGHPLPDNAVMERWDQRAQSDFGLPGMVLMERAALSAWSALRDSGRAGPYLILAGSGNNGGDALALARLLYQSGQSVRVFLAASQSGKYSDSNLAQQTILRHCGILLSEVGEITQVNGQFSLTSGLGQALAESNCLIDGLVGVGLRQALREPLASLISAICQIAPQLPRIALDLPSGLYDGWEAGQPVLPATATWCFGYAKRCLYHGPARALAGQVQVLDCGFPPNLPQNDPIDFRLLDPVSWRGPVPPIKPDSHKFQRGVVAVVAGSIDYPGAALLSARAAAASRAGLVRLYLDPPLRPQLASLAGSLVLATSPELQANAIVIGPGWGRASGRQTELVQWLGQAAALGIPAVIDADALHALANLKPNDFAPAGPAGRPWILTPHLAELAKLAGQTNEAVAAQPWQFARQVAAVWSCTVILKGAVTVIVQASGQVQIVDAANPVLATAGSGDVFAGICGALLAAWQRQDGDASAACQAGAESAPQIWAQVGSEAARQGLWVNAEALVERLPAYFGAISPPETRNTLYTKGGFLKPEGA